MSSTEQPCLFTCAGQTLLAIVHKPERAADCGVMIVVGGPQYRVGSHRQFVLLARDLADHGLPVLRFDYRGMGDSEGEPMSFEATQEDIAAALTLFFTQVPHLKKVVLWGLCDAASAALFYAHQDPRVSGLVLLNPWVRTEAGLAKTYLKHYYLQRLMSASFWKKLLSGQWQAGAALASLLAMCRKAMGKGQREAAVAVQQLSLPERMAQALEKFPGKILLILSGADYVADEFRDLVAASPKWQRLLADKPVVRKELANANHTFARAEWRDEVANITRAWLQAELGQ